MESPLEQLKAKYVTQEEATAMVELWGRLKQEQQASNMLTLDDVSEALNISKEESAQLLAMVRRQRTESPVQTPPHAAHGVFPIVLATIITPTMVLAVLFLGMLLFEAMLGHQYWSRELKVIMFLVMVWLAFWLAFYRRPISKFFKSYF